MRRVVGDGVDLFEIIVDDEGETSVGASHAPHLAGHEAVAMPFFDPSEARRFLQRVADDYSERLALREVLSHLWARDDVFRVNDAEMFVLLAELLVSGRLSVNRLQRATHA